MLLTFFTGRALEGNSKGTQRTLGHLRHSKGILRVLKMHLGIWALQGHLGTPRAHGQLSYFGNWALQALYLAEFLRK